ncbi:MAG: IS21 family transposase [Gemmatimonadota bacterium]
MAAERLSMRKIKEVLRLQAADQSQRTIAHSVGIARSTVKEYLQRAAAAGIAWPLPDDVTDSALEARLFPAAISFVGPRPLPEFRVIHDELKAKRRTGVTLQLLWLEYKEANPDGLQYSQFCECYRRWRGGLDRVLRQEHKAGEKVFVDFAGQTVPIIDRATGEVLFEAEIFVAVLGASNYTYAQACRSQELPEWISAHTRMVEYFGGVTRAVVPDNLRSGVRRACYYEPDLNPTYQEWAEHYGTAVLPARVRRPRDKAKVESGVLLVERWILARLRHHTFFDLADLNTEIARLLELLNTRPFQKLEGSRRSLFETLDHPALLPLPATRYDYAQWKKAAVNIDYHVDVLGHFYSVPYQLERARVDVRITNDTVEIFHDGRRVAAHARGRKKGGFTTDSSHRPKSHQKYLEWTPSRMIRWGEQTGPRTAEMVRRILESRPHPEQGYRACLGLLRLGERYSSQRLEAACARALHVGAVSYQSVKSILSTGLDQVPLEEQTTLALPQNHEHVRGEEYYATAATGE